ncbi:hypothetical protein [Metallumcola ferriviriculae]
MESKTTDWSTAFKYGAYIIGLIAVLYFLAKYIVPLMWHLAG